MLSFCRRLLCGLKPNRFREKTEEELSHHYEPTRYCRVRIGDTLGERYQILGKLGWGQFSTVWFAKDNQYEWPCRLETAQLMVVTIRNQQWVSIKVLTRTSFRDPRYERDILTALRKGDANQPGYSRIVHLLHSFIHKESHGRTHLCLVYKAMGESLSYFQSRFPRLRFPLPLMRRITYQLFQALDYIHSHGVIHTGKDNVSRVWTC